MNKKTSYNKKINPTGAKPVLISNRLFTSGLFSSLSQIKLGERMLLRTFCIFLVFASLGMLPTGANGNDSYLDEADKALSELKSWSDLRKWFANYPGYDDGYYAEGVSEFVTAKLAKEWNTLKSLNAEIIKNPDFEERVLMHVDATADEQNLIKIVENARNKCPAELRSLCKKIEKNAKMAVKDIKSIKK